MKRPVSMENQENFNFVDDLKDVLPIIGMKCELHQLVNYYSTCKKIREVCSNDKFMDNYIKSYHFSSEDKKIQVQRNSFYYSQYWRMPSITCAVSIQISKYPETEEGEVKDAYAVVSMIKSTAFIHVN
jgi:hypothetical protein